MPSWGDHLNELNAKDCNGNLLTDIDSLRRKYLLRLHELTKRNIIAYYSGYMTCTSERTNIEDNDINGFMNAIYKLDKSIGLDLILHTPGGTISSACAIVTYLRSVFGNNIRCIIPQAAMSAGTMIACACSEIIMGNHSSIGPIDPQFGAISTGDVIEEATQAKKEMADSPGSIPYWNALLAKYPPAFIGKCEKAAQFAAENVEQWLLENMFFDDDDKKRKVKRIVSDLSDHKKTRQHDKHISVIEAQSLGLKVRSLESSGLQDAILSVHHAYMLTFSRNDRVAKVVENHRGKAMVLFHAKSV